MNDIREKAEKALTTIMHMRPDIKMGVDLARPGSDKTHVAVGDGDTLSMITPPPWAGEIVNVCDYGGSVLVFCARAIFRLKGQDLIPLRFKQS